MNHVEIQQTKRNVHKHICFMQHQVSGRSSCGLGGLEDGPPGTPRGGVTFTPLARVALATPGGDWHLSCAASVGFVAVIPQWFPNLHLTATKTPGS